MSSSVVSVSVSKPEKMIINGMEVSTSIIKKPGEGPVYFDLDGPVGNETAVHPEAVYAFLSEQYDFWAHRFGVARSSWQFGHWGENLTLHGLDETSVRIGDVLSVGEEVSLQVTSPRIPCFKLTWRLGQPESELKTLTDSGLLGFYLRVLKPGYVKAGDSVTVTRPHPNNIGVVDLCKVLHDKASSVEQLRGILPTQGLSPLPLDFLRKRINQLTDVTVTRQGRWTGWRPFVVATIEQTTEDVKSFYLKPLDGGTLAGYRAGQFLTFQIDAGDGRPIVRTWSLSDYQPAGDVYRISVKREPNGIASNWAHECLSPGSVMHVRNPAGNFVLDRSSLFPAVFISGGIGVTPVLSMLKSHLERAEQGNAPPAIWIHCTRNGATHAFAREVAALKERHGLRSRIVYSQPTSADQMGIHHDQDTRLSVADIATCLVGLTINVGGREVTLPPQAAEFYICGPQAMQDALSRDLATWGVAPSAIHCETFGTPSVAPRIASRVAAAEVTFARSDRTVAWLEDDNATLLELADRAGLDLESSCRSGICHSCKATLLEGEVAYEREVSGVEANKVLLCCARPASKRVLVDA
ncbi:MOSC domain-containing protein [Paraburkholderia sediminicola]|uniref:MOSC domain-containing protein n=1 Tax=Paraburkholderia sediminicola TaxID=458836 RepID=UPI0038BDA796